MAEAKRRLAAILSADVLGYSRLMGDDEEWVPDLVTVELAAGTDVKAILDDGVIHAVDKARGMIAA